MHAVLCGAPHAGLLNILSLILTISPSLFSSPFRVEYRIKQTPSRPIPVSNARIGTLEENLHPDDELAAHYDMAFGTTPPRTRQKIKNRDWERKQKVAQVVA